MADYLSSEDAVSRLMDSTPIPVEPHLQVSEAPEPAAETPTEADEPQSEADPAAETDLAADAPSEIGPAGPAEPVETPAIEPPHFWNAEKKAEFAKLPPELQTLLKEQADNGVKAVNQSLEKAAETRKAAEEAVKKADAEYASLTALNQRLGEVLPKAEEQFKSRWGHLTPADWLELARENPDRYVEAKALFDTETAELQRLQDAKKDVDAAETKKRDDAHQAYQASEVEALKAYAPELADPKTAKETSEKLVNYLKTSLGVTPQEMPGIPAKALAAALKAMKYDELMARAKTPSLPPAKTPPAPAVKPRAGGAQTPRTAEQASLAALKKSGKPEDAIALLLSRS
jgi:hypothetical protein